MKDRYKNRRLYFDELAETSSVYFMKYISEFYDFAHLHKVLEIGCGEGGILMPFAKMGCDVYGVDISKTKIENAMLFFSENQLEGQFICCDFLQMNLTEYTGIYDLIIVHDVIEHIEPDSKREFMLRARSLLKEDGVMFAAFPAWKMAFGGHQQICTKRLCRIPFLHLLPTCLYENYLKIFGEDNNTIAELSSIKMAGMSIESFEKLCSCTSLIILDRKLWLINPHYKVKFGLKPRQLSICISKNRCLRNYLSSSCFYILMKNPNDSGTKIDKFASLIK